MAFRTIGFEVSQDLKREGNAVHFVPVIDLTMASPRNDCHQLLVYCYHMIRLEFRKLPVLLKFITLSLTLKSKIIAALHSGQNFTVIGAQQSLSLTRWCPIKLRSG